MSGKTGVAVIGLGYWGPNILRNFLALKHRCIVRQVCDRSNDRLRHLHGLHPELAQTCSVDDLLDDPEIEAVAIATPVSTHHALASRCLDRGKHVLVEKPLAASTAECDDLIQRAQANHRILMVGHTFIYTAAVQYIKGLIEREELGDLLYISSSRLNLGLVQSDINVAWDLAPHDLSIILYLLQKDPLWVNCQGSRHLNGQEDVTSMTLTFPGGTMAIIQSSWLDPNKVRKMTIVGSERMVVYDDIEPLEKVRIYDKHVEAPPYFDTFHDFHFSYHYGDVHVPYLRQQEPLYVECEHFLDCIDNDCRPSTCGRAGRKVVQILEMASLSMRQGGAGVSAAEFASRASDMERPLISLQA